MAKRTKRRPTPFSPTRFTERRAAPVVRARQAPQPAQEVEAPQQEEEETYLDNLEHEVGTEVDQPPLEAPDLDPVAPGTQTFDPSEVVGAAEDRINRGRDEDDHTHLPSGQVVIEDGSITSAEVSYDGRGVTVGDDKVAIDTGAWGGSVAWDPETGLTVGGDYSRDGRGGSLSLSFLDSESYQLLLNAEGELAGSALSSRDSLGFDLGLSFEGAKVGGGSTAWDAFEVSAAATDGLALSPEQLRNRVEVLQDQGVEGDDLLAMLETWQVGDAVSMSTGASDRMSLGLKGGILDFGLSEGNAVREEHSIAAQGDGRFTISVLAGEDHSEGLSFGAGFVGLDLNVNRGSAQFQSFDIDITTPEGRYDMVVYQQTGLLPGAVARPSNLDETNAVQQAEAQVASMDEAEESVAEMNNAFIENAEDQELVDNGYRELREDDILNSSGDLNVVGLSLLTESTYERQSESVHIANGEVTHVSSLLQEGRRGGLFIDETRTVSNAQIEHGGRARFDYITNASLDAIEGRDPEGEVADHHEENKDFLDETTFSAGFTTEDFDGFLDTVKDSEHEFDQQIAIDMLFLHDGNIDEYVRHIPTFGGLDRFVEAYEDGGYGSLAEMVETFENDSSLPLSPRAFAQYFGAEVAGVDMASFAENYGAEDADLFMLETLVEIQQNSTVEDGIDFSALSPQAVNVAAFMVTSRGDGPERFDVLHALDGLSVDNRRSAFLHVMDSLDEEATADFDVWLQTHPDLDASVFQDDVRLTAGSSTVNESIEGWLDARADASDEGKAETRTERSQEVIDGLDGVLDSGGEDLAAQVISDLAQTPITDERNPYGPQAGPLELLVASAGTAEQRASLLAFVDLDPAASQRMAEFAASNPEAFIDPSLSPEAQQRFFEEEVVPRMTAHGVLGESESLARRGEANLIARDSGWGEVQRPDVLADFEGESQLTVNIAANIDHYDLAEIARYDELTGGDLLGDVEALIQRHPELLPGGVTNPAAGPYLHNLVMLSEEHGRDYFAHTGVDQLNLSMTDVFGFEFEAITPTMLTDFSQGVRILDSLPEHRTEGAGESAAYQLSNALGEDVGDLSPEDRQVLLDTALQLVPYGDGGEELLQTVQDTLGVDLRNPMAALENGLDHGFDSEGKVIPIEDVLGNLYRSDRPQLEAHVANVSEAAIESGDVAPLLDLLDGVHGGVFIEMGGGSHLGEAAADSQVRHLLESSLPEGQTLGDLFKALPPQHHEALLLQLGEDPSNVNTALRYGVPEIVDEDGSRVSVESIVRAEGVDAFLRPAMTHALSGDGTALRTLIEMTRAEIFAENPGVSYVVVDAMADTAVQDLLADADLDRLAENADPATQATLQGAGLA